MKTIFALLVLALPGVAFAQINKCVDATGKVVGYAAQCPAGTRSEQTSIKNTPPPAGSEQKTLSERDADFRKRQMEKQESTAKAEKKNVESAQQKRACDDARAYLRTLKDGQRIARTDAKTGERTFLQDSEYPKEIARAEQSISANCK